MADRLLIYGANGYTGALVARYAADRGLEPILAGRSAAAVDAVARRHGFDVRVFGLDVPSTLDANLDGVACVLHCAGPFSRTSKPMFERPPRALCSFGTRPSKLPADSLPLWRPEGLRGPWLGKTWSRAWLAPAFALDRRRSLS